MAATNRYRLLMAVILAMASFAALNTRAQTEASIQKNFDEHKETNFREKLFVHVSKSFYTTGEIAWFKIYCTDARDNKLSGLSKVAYVELIDAEKNAPVQTMIALNDGTGSGSVFLPFTMNSGVYRLRAYTNWMKNFDAGHFFESTITIVNPLRPTPVVKQASSSFLVEFMPEGGHLVQNISTKVAFKVTGDDGRGAAATGAILNQRGDTVARFSSLKFGIGSFLFKPLANEDYKAIVRVNNQTLTGNVPQVSLSGYVLNVADSGNAWNVRVRNSDSTVTKAVYLVLHNNYTARQVKELRLNNGSGDLSVNKTDAEDGINYITLFNDAGVPVCERMVFKRPSAKLSINASTDRSEYDRRNKVAVSLSAVDESKHSQSANLSVSVFRADGLQSKDPDHISGYLWLRATLKGYIESPDYYLDNTSKEADEALDNLLLTQGWTQFDWSAHAAKMRFLPEYTGPIVTARVTNLADNTPAPDKMVYLTINGSPQQLYVGKSDAAGKVMFNTRNFYGPREVVVQTNGQVDSTYRVDIQTPYVEPGTGIQAGTFSLTADMKKAVNESSVNMQVQNLFSANQARQFNNVATDSTWFFGKPFRSYKLDDYTRFTTMEEVLREYVVSIGVVKHQGKFNIKMFNGDVFLGNPLVLLDGIPVFDIDKLFKWDPLKIKRLDEVTSNYVYGPAVFNGIMSFTTYRGDGAAIEIDPHAVVVDYEGLQQERKFYQPVYDTEALSNSTIPDFRTALYWNPNVITDTNGKQTFTFYTSDKPGQYIGIVEGISANGKAGSSYFSFTVKK